MTDTNPLPDMTPDEQYLWDATGKPGPAVLQIEAALSKQRYSASRLSLNLARPSSRADGVLSPSPPRSSSPPPSRCTCSESHPDRLRRLDRCHRYRQAERGPNPSQAFSARRRSCPTDPASSASLTFRQGTHVRLGPSSDTTVTGGPDIQLAKGEALVEVPANFPPARVTTPSFACTLAPGSAAGIETN